MRRIVVMLAGAALTVVMMLATAMPAFAQRGGPPDECRNTTEETLDCTGGSGSGGYPEYGGIGGGHGGNVEIDFATGEGVQSGGGGSGGQYARPGGGGFHCTGDFDDPDYECVGGSGYQPL